MPLYGNILLSSEDAAEKPNQQDAKTQVKTSTPSASMRLLQDHLISKRRYKQTSLQPQKVQRILGKSQIPVGATVKYSQLDWDLFDEYDPMVPNSYEMLQLEAFRAEEQKVNAMKSSAGKIDRNVLDVLDRLEEDEQNGSRTHIGAAIAPPQLSRTLCNEGNSSDIDATKSVRILIGNTEKVDGTSAAAKIMAKMGFKAGQGLGRNEQGINAPLEVEKSGPSAGRIVQKSVTVAQIETEPDCTRVLLLQNMVGPGEVDDELEEETKMECTKYGEVVKCLIYEIPNKKVPDDQAVRIFIEFEDPASARRAADELHGRYFGGRIVRASFYEVDKFHRYELGP